MQEFVGFTPRANPTQLADALVLAAAVEERLIEQLLELDAIDVPILTPGYVHPTKVVLAYRADRPQRVHLGAGAFAESVLWYGPQGWCGHPWTPAALLTHRGLHWVGRLRDAALSDAKGGV
ncbi:MAG: DUF4416 family protein [Phycisphaerales bacterium]|nr:DUF4416 family protein [Phycisphaerales bacterium]